MSAPDRKIYDELDAYFKGPSSKKVSNNLDGVSPDLGEIVNKATNYLGYEPKVTSGFRTQAEQDALNVPGKAKVSMHSAGQAIDQSIKGLDSNKINDTLKYYNSQPGLKADVHNGNHIHVEYRPLKKTSKEDYDSKVNELNQMLGGSNNSNPNKNDYESKVNELNALLGYDSKPSPNDLVKTISSQNGKINNIANQQKLLNTIKEQNDKITQSVNPARLIAKQIGNEQVKAINSGPQFKIPDLVQDNKIETIAPKRTLKKVESVLPQPKMKGLLKEKYDENPNVQQFFDEWLAAPKDLGETELIPPAVSRIIGKALTSVVAPFLPPEEVSKKIGLDNLANVRGGVDASLGKMVGGLTTPKNLAIAASMETPVAPYVLAGLTPGAVKGAYQSGDESINRFAEGDVKGGAEHLLDSILNAGMAVGGGIGAAKGLKIGSPKINSPIVDAPIPEAPATLDLQIKALKEGRTNAALVTPGAKIPEVPKGMNIADTPAGVWIFNPKKISSVDIANSIKNGTHGELLGYVEPKSEATTATVVAKAPNGVEAKTALVSPENINLQAKVLKDQFPDSKIEVGGLEKTQEILDKRKQDSTYLGSGFGGLQKFIEKTPEEISREQSLSAIKTQAQKTGKKLVEAMDDLEIPFNPQLYSDVMLAQRELAAKADKKSVLNHAKDFYREAKAKLIDYNSPIEDLLASAQKKGKFEILPEYKYKNQVDAVIRSPKLAGQFVKSNGFDRIIKEVDNLNNLDQYMIAKHAIDVEGKGIKTGRDLLKDQQLVEAFAPKYEQAAQKVGEYSRRLLDYSVDSGLVSKELASALKEKYPNYVPLNRVFSEIEELGQFHPKGVASLSKQSVVQKLEGSEREIQSPVQSLIEKTHDAFVQGERNKAGRILSEMKDLPGNPLQLRPLRTAENVTKRGDLYEEIAELIPLRNKVSNLIIKKDKLLKKLNSEINSLEKSGLQIALNKTYSEPETLKSSLKEKRVFSDSINLKLKELDGRAKEIREQINDLNKEGLLLSLKKKQRPKPTMLSSGFKITSQSIKDFPAQIKLRGPQSAKSFIESRYADAVPQLKQIQKKILEKEQTLSGIESQINRLDSSSRKHVSYETNYAVSQSKGKQSTKSFIERLITDENVDLNSIKSKIDRRQRELHDLLDDIMYLREGFESIQNKRAALFDEAKLLRDAKANGKETISFFNNGIKEIWETTPEISAAAKSLNVQQLNVLGRIFALPVRLAKTGITGWNIPFTTSNLIRDQFTAFINTKNPMATMPFSKAFFESLLNVVKRGDLYKEFVEQAAGGTSFDIARNAAPLTIDRIRAGRSLKDRVKYTVKHPSELLRAVEDIIGRSEEITRMQQYAGTKRANLKKGMSEQRAKISAAEAARENTANFARTGEWGPVLNSAFLYLNAAKEGTRAFLRGARRAPAQTAVKVGTVILFPQIISTLWNLSDPERRKAYQDIPDYVKDTNLVYIPPNPTQDDKERWNVIKIPLEPGIGKLATPARRIVEQMNGLDPVKFGEVANSVFSAFSPVDASAKSLLSTFTPQIIKPSIEAYTNKNFFTDSPIVPPSLEKLSPEKQVKERTSGTARQIGSQLGVSPIKVEEFIKSTFGGVGQQGLNLVDRAQYAAGRIPKEQIGGQSILEGIESRFTKAAGGKIERDLYSDINKASQKQMDARDDLKQQAKNILKSWSLYSQENFEKNLQELEKNNPDLAKKVSQLKEEQDGKIGPTDKAISALGIKNGVRAQFIYSHVKSMSQGEKTKFLEDLWNKKLLTNEVFNQMIKIKNNQPIGGEDE